MNKIDTRFGNLYGGAFIHRLQHFEILDDSCTASLAALSLTTRDAAAGSELVHEGEPQTSTWIVQSGWGLRHKNLADGRRQIVNFVLPGDIVGLFAPLVAMTLLLGIYPSLALDQIGPSVAALLNNYELALAEAQTQLAEN